MNLHQRWQAVVFKLNIEILAATIVASVVQINGNEGYGVMSVHREAAAIGPTWVAFVPGANKILAVLLILGHFA